MENKDIVNFLQIKDLGKKLSGLKSYLTAPFHRELLMFIMQHSPNVGDITKHLQKTNSNWTQCATSQRLAFYYKAGLIVKIKHGKYTQIVISNYFINLINVLKNENNN